MYLHISPIVSSSDFDRETNKYVAPSVFQNLFYPLIHTAIPLNSSIPVRRITIAIMRIRVYTCIRFVPFSFLSAIGYEIL